MKVINRFFNKRKLIVWDMLICLVCVFILSIFFYKTELIGETRMDMMILAIILLPLTIVFSMIILKCYTDTKENFSKQINRCILAIFLGIVMYITLDFIFGIYDLMLLKIISGLIAGYFILCNRRV